jgi:Uma2 family endonuclease
MITKLKQLDLNKSYTYADYLTWQFDEMVELVKGKIMKMSPAPKRIHQGVAGKLFMTLGGYFYSKPCEVYIAPFDVRLSRSKNNNLITTVVQPDLSVICDTAKLDDNGCLGAPDFIIEVLSKSTFKYDYTDKFALYEENKVKEYWLADPGQKFIDCYILKRGKYERTALIEEPGQIATSILFPHLEFAWEDIFQ